MKCPYCHEGDFQVIDSRAPSDGFPVRRRRVCPACKRRVFTVEIIEDSPLKVVKKDGAREDFDREKLRRGLQRACYKRPVSEEQLDAIVRRVEAEAHARYWGEVPASALGESLMDYLKELDQVAYVRFASVYREFKDVSDFMQEVQPMLPRGKGKGKRPRRRTSR
jgi:transcriptional repressor NrdR